MFVTKNRVIIKTCGSTTLLHCLDQLFPIIKEAGFETIEVSFVGTIVGSIYHCQWSTTGVFVD